MADFLFKGLFVCAMICETHIIFEMWSFFSGRGPSWSEGPDMMVARDAAAWALEGDHLFVLGGVLGKLSGYTDSVEMYDLNAGVWKPGPNMLTSRQVFTRRKGVLYETENQ